MENLISIFATNKQTHTHTSHSTHSHLIRKWNFIYKQERKKMNRNTHTHRERDYYKKTNIFFKQITRSIYLLCNFIDLVKRKLN